MQLSNQESAENLKEIMNHIQESLREMQSAYLRQSMQTCIDYFEGEADITDVRKITIDLDRACGSDCIGHFIVIGALERFTGLYDGEWSMEDWYGVKDGWNKIYNMSKGDKKLRIIVETHLTTELTVHD